MLTCRISPSVRGDDRRLAAAIAQALTADPLRGELTGTVMLGAGGVGVLHADDAHPRVLVVLGEHDATSALAHATAARVDAIVTLGARARRAIVVAAAPGAPVIAVDDRREAPRAFLMGATDDERVAAWRQVRGVPQLAQALGVAAPPVVPAAGGMRRVTEAILEAIVAAGRG